MKLGTLGHRRDGTSTFRLPLPANVAARRFLLLAIWIGFLGDLMVGAGFLISRDPRLNAIGLAMVLGAVAVMVGFTLYYYVQQRRTRGA